MVHKNGNTYNNNNLKCSTTKAFFFYVTTFIIVHSIFFSTKRFRESLLKTVVSNGIQIVLSRLLTIFKHHCIDREDCWFECYIFEELKLKKIAEMKSHLSSEYNMVRVLY